MAPVNPHFLNAKNLFKSALLPDKAVRGFVNAALDGSGQTSRLRATLSGLRTDLFEAGPDLASAFKELARGVRG